MQYKLLKSVKARSFNKRSKKSALNNLPIRFNCGLFTLKQFFFEFIYIKTLKIFFKHMLKYKYAIFKKFPIFFYLKPNLPISTKSKNSRMGKGIGKFLTWVFVLKTNSLILSFGSFIFKRFIYYETLVKKRISKNLKFFKYSSDF